MTPLTIHKGSAKSIRLQVHINSLCWFCHSFYKMHKKHKYKNSDWFEAAVSGFHCCLEQIKHDNKINWTDPWTFKQIKNKYKMFLFKRIHMFLSKSFHSFYIPMRFILFLASRLDFNFEEARFFLILTRKKAQRK